jgi:predicted enzyme related to lactoylglutathione lyase
VISGITDRTVSRRPVKLILIPRQLDRRNPMSFASIRIVTDDLDGLVAFYEQVIGQPAERPAPVFAQFNGPGANLAIASTATVAMLGGALAPATNRSVFIEFEVADVDGEFAKLQPESEDVVLEPTTMPWGNRSAMVRDPDGNVVNLFSKPTTN